jgi:tetratricopeptide (TPR) repeat protein
MAYKEPETALHHLKMANSYLDDAQRTIESTKDASQFISQLQMRSLAEAAQHLNKARAIDPTEVLWVDDEKENVRLKMDQDYLTSRVLVYEGVAQINSAREIWTTYEDTDGKINRSKYNDGVRNLELARDTLEKALKYNPVSADGLNFLQLAYQYLSDAQNFRRILERRIELRPDDIALHKQIKELNQNPVLTPYFKKPPLISFTAALWLSVPIGLILATIGVNTGFTPLLALGMILFWGPIAFWILKIIWRENFG